MTLVDLLEMPADWKAATERTSLGDLADSLTINRERFGIAPQLMDILTNTARHFGWLTAAPDRTAMPRHGVAAETSTGVDSANRPKRNSRPRFQ